MNFKIYRWTANAQQEEQTTTEIEKPLLSESSRAKDVFWDVLELGPVILSNEFPCFSTRSI